MIPSVEVGTQLSKSIAESLIKSGKGTEFLKFFNEEFYILFASTGAVLTSLIPVPSLASVGTYEGGWVATLALLGIASEKALLIGFTVHVINFTFCLVLGLGGLVYLQLKR